MLNNNRSTYLNNGATLVIRSDDVFKNKDYMKGGGLLEVNLLHKANLP